MKEIYWVRHGQASFGSDNYDNLSPLGHQQARWLGEYFADNDLTFERVIVGDMVRHQQTATGICQGLGITPCDFEVMPALDEFDFYALVKAYLTKNPQLIPARRDDAKAYLKLLKQSVIAWQQQQLPLPLPESWQEFAQRVKQALTQLHHSMQQASKSQQRILVVSSGGVTAMAMKHILDLNDEQVMPLNLQISNTSVSRFYCSDKQIQLSSFNHVPHLDNPLLRENITYS